MIEDPINIRILKQLQRDCRQSLAELGQRVGLSPSACHRRVQQMEEAGIIAGYGARLDPRLLGYAMEFFVEVSLKSQSDKALAAFERAVAARPEILECHLMTGGSDYLLRIVAADAADFERIHRECLSGLPNVARLVSHLSIRTVRPWTGYPVAGAVA
ncbi:MAG: Lrp/AsnC family transcriptional regulator [Hyphomicrobiaceae bacterium]|nr:Lrp/AsnC family transcriptional regulator [Hyphomicrobiaceae bacterium]